VDYLTQSGESPRMGIVKVKPKVYRIRVNDEDGLSKEDRIPPAEAAENARRGLKCVEEVDTDAGEAQGRDTAEKIINAVENEEPLSEEFISDIASFDRHREQGNHTVDEKFEGTPCQDNGYVSWQLWGGDAGVDWAQDTNES